MNPAFNDFLFAPIREEKNGMILSVISGLTRLDIDPWAEAARLAALPKAIAAQAFAPIIARLEEGGAELFDARKVADRLIGLLPAGASPLLAERGKLDGKGKHLPLAIWLIFLVLGAIAFLGATTTRQEGSVGKDPSSAQSATAVSPPLPKE